MAIGKARTGRTDLDPVPHIPQDNVDGVINRVPLAVPVPTRNAIVDSQYVNTAILTMHTEGDNWFVNYYRQLLGLSDALRSWDVSAMAASQQYELTKKYIIKVDSALVPSQDDATKEFSVAGEGGMVYGLVPNKGDMFTADIGGGQMGLFVVVSSERRNPLKQSTYQVRYGLHSILTPELLAKLDAKVVKKQVFVPSLIERFLSPFLTEAANAAVIDLETIDIEQREHFMNMFWSTDVVSIKLPTSECRYYDGFHAVFCKYLGLGNIRRPIDYYKYGEIGDGEYYTLWDMIIKGEGRVTREPIRDVGVLSVKAFTGIHVQRGVRWSPYSHAIFPRHETFGMSEESKALVNATILMTLPEEDKLVPVVALPEPLGENNTLSGRPMYYPLSFTPYVLSTAFYDGNVNDMCVFELMLNRILKGDAIPHGITSALATELYKLPLMSQYYYGPLLLAIVHYSMQM